MRFLLSNDDGYSAQGLAHLANAFRRLGEVHVVAPEGDRSGASNSLTLDRPVWARTAHTGFQYVNGTPTDCVHLALTSLLGHRPDMVISGINHGANLGGDTLYSGTVAAAMEAYQFGIPALAISLVGRDPIHFETAAQVAVDLVERLISQPLPHAYLLSVNVPDCPYADLKGMQITRLGHRLPSQAAIPTVRPGGETLYWVGPAGAEAENGPGTDFHAIATGYVSITPLQLDLTANDSVATFTEWLHA